MKTICTIILALITTIGFSQEKEQRKEMRQKMMQERQDLSPEQKAELSTKRLTLQLDLTEVQHKEIYEMYLTNAKQVAEKRKLNNNTNQKELYDRASERLNRRKAIQDKMKSILSESQYNTWKENSKLVMRNKAKKNHNKKQ
tara:strand:- start:8890 stop:9315 length:426 start_codon:yes stop_codon:yes gene_type:complete